MKSMDYQIARSEIRLAFPVLNQIDFLVLLSLHALPIGFHLEDRFYRLS